MYWSHAESVLGDSIIREYAGDNNFGALLISNRFGTQFGKQNISSLTNDTNKMTQILKSFNLPYFYWSYLPICETPFNFINKALDMRNISLRIQLYI